MIILRFIIVSPSICKLTRSTIFKLQYILTVFLHIQILLQKCTFEIFKLYRFQQIYQKLHFSVWTAQTYPNTYPEVLYKSNPFNIKFGIQHINFALYIRNLLSMDIILNLLNIAKRSQASFKNYHINSSSAISLFGSKVAQCNPSSKRVSSPHLQKRCST